MTRGAHQLGWRAAIGWTDVAGTALSCPVLFSFSRSGQRERKRERGAGERAQGPELLRGRQGEQRGGSRAAVGVLRSGESRERGVAHSGRGVRLQWLRLRLRRREGRKEMRHLRPAAVADRGRGRVCVCSSSAWRGVARRCPPGLSEGTEERGGTVARRRGDRYSSWSGIIRK
jgi:hypothetical protein